MSRIDEYEDFPLLHAPVVNTVELATAICPTLRAAAASIEAILTDVAPPFLAIGTQLQTVFSEATTLAHTTIEAEQLHGGSAEQGFMQQVQQLAYHAIDDLTACEDRVAASLHDISIMTQNIGELQNGTEPLKAIAKRLHIISLYCAVESSRSPEAANKFTSFLEQMAKLVDMISDIRKRLHENIDISQAQLRAATENLIRDTAQLTTVRSAAGQAVRETANGVEEIIRQSLAAVEETTRCLQSITRHIGAVVMAMQFHDIVRQQLEHIMTALREIEAASSSMTDQYAPPDSADAVLAETHAALRVQLAQLAQVITTVEQTDHTIKTSFQAIAEETTDLMTSINKVGGSAQAGVAEDTPFQRLLQELQRLAVLKQQSDQLQESSKLVTAQAVTATGLFTQHIEEVREVNDEINLQALNAIINAQRLGEHGHALSVLAEEIMRTSDDCTVAVNAIVAHLEGIISAAHSNDQQCQQTTDRPQHSAEVSTRAIEAAVLGTSEAFTQLSTAATAIKQQATPILAAIAQVDEERVFLRQFAARLQQEYAELAQVQQALQPWEQALPDLAQEHLAQQANRYTMDSERTVHRQVVGADNAPDADIELWTDNTEDDAGEFGDNVELF